MTKVVSTSNRNPKARTVEVDRPAPAKATFIRATLKGMGVTVRHFFTNVATKRDIETVNYPEEKVPYPERHRGLHRLMLRDDGNVRCVACMCCPTVCPANCITIIPEEASSNSVEKKPAIFEIDELRCVVCGLCVEACPCDAIRMDTGKHAKPVEERGHGIITLERMLANTPKERKGIDSDPRSIAVQGGVGPDWRDS